MNRRLNGYDGAAASGGNLDYWRNVPGMGGLYRINRDGEIVKVNRCGSMQVIVKRGVRHRTNRYPVLTKPNGAKVICSVLTLLAETFLMPAPNGYEWTCANGDRTDLRVENLVLTGTVGSCRRPKTAGAVNVVKVDADGQVIERYRSISEAARRNYLSESSVSRRCKGTISEPYRLTGYTFAWESEGE